MMSKEDNLEWLRRRMEAHRSGKNDVSDLVEELE
jgi:hypothetical protein